MVDPRSAPGTHETPMPHDADAGILHPMVTPPRSTAAERFARAVWGPLLGLLVNVVLVVAKVLGGLASGSAALLADAGHSGADVANNVLVLASLFYARRPADETHPYGHDRAEVLAAIGSSFFLAAAGLFFGWDSMQKLIVGIPAPTPLALWVAIGTLVVKLVVARVEGGIARTVTSQAVLADARDSLTDVLSSIAVIIGVLGARLGHPRWDGAAGVAIALLILFTAIQIGGAASHELLDHNLDPALLARVRAAAAEVPEVLGVRAATGRSHGSDVLVELSIEVDPAMTVQRASGVADAVRRAVYADVPEVGDAVVELNTDHLARLWGRLR
ncbi:MAG TPA: cation diffusion facilitator family transporter [Ktedonobacterales bacterium]|nr:cation diffusion facilitator family transporter [Ktedonobacterales bacterium]